ncbi:MucBP domain-containing protein [Enterococcus faecalis]|uniref:MucBP domain-containing protein n=1 Tax=Enterococcus faecalis TaxID=1351 RepID=UPI001C4601DA|nr:MucBP domain-containing protein [Enterococcus faecalis]MBV6961639.1 MucBP domain-containing protein [Enterococcus faecalis]
MKNKVKSLPIKISICFFGILIGLITAFTVSTTNVFALDSGIDIELVTEDNSIAPATFSHYRLAVPVTPGKYTYKQIVEMPIDQSTDSIKLSTTREIIEELNNLLRKKITPEEYVFRMYSSWKDDVIKDVYDFTSLYAGYVINENKYNQELEKLYDPNTPLEVTLSRITSRTIIHYQYEDGTIASEDKIIEGVQGVDAPVVVQSPVIKGYSPDKENVTVVFGKEDEITVIYKKDKVLAQNIVIKYQDSKGNTIHPDQEISGYVDDMYDASDSKYKLDIDGYKLDETKLPGNLKGTFSDKPQVVLFVYTSTSDTSTSDTSTSDTSTSDTSTSDTSTSDTSTSDTSMSDTSMSDTSMSDTSMSGTSMSGTSISDTSTDTRDKNKMLPRAGEDIKTKSLAVIGGFLVVLTGVVLFIRFK